jgi:hypothetical protein
MAHQPTGASGKKVKLSLTVFLSREQAGGPILEPDRQDDRSMSSSSRPRAMTLSPPSSSVAAPLRRGVPTDRGPGVSRS